MHPLTLNYHIVIPEGYNRFLFPSAHFGGLLVRAQFWVPALTSGTFHTWLFYSVYLTIPIPFFGALTLLFVISAASQS